MRVWTALLCLGLGACVSQAEFDKVEKERADLEQKQQAVADSLKAKERELAAAKRQIADLKQQREQKNAAVHLEACGLKPGQKAKAEIITSLGSISCDLMPDVAPETVANFIGLSEGTKSWTDPKTRQKREDPLYNNTIFHRVIKGFMIQGGDPMGNGRGGPGYRFGDEVTPDVQFDGPGILAMANAGPGTNGSQFFITDGPTPHLNMRHTIFGKCDMETVAKIRDQPMKPSRGRGPSSDPVDPVVIQQIKITRL